MHPLLTAAVGSLLCCSCRTLSTCLSGWCRSLDWPAAAIKGTQTVVDRQWLPFLYFVTLTLTKQHLSSWVCWILGCCHGQRDVTSQLFFLSCECAQRLWMRSEALKESLSKQCMHSASHSADPGQCTACWCYWLVDMVLAVTDARGVPGLKCGCCMLKVLEPDCMLVNQAVHACMRLVVGPGHSLLTVPLQPIAKEELEAGW